jgi:antitoxin ParD1/3/4
MYEPDFLFGGTPTLAQRHPSQGSNRSSTSTEFRRHHHRPEMPADHRTAKSPTNADHQTSSLRLFVSVRHKCSGGLDRHEHRSFRQRAANKSVALIERHRRVVAGTHLTATREIDKACQATDPSPGGWVEQQASSGRFANASDYVRHPDSVRSRTGSEDRAYSARMTEGIASGVGRRSMDALKTAARSQARASRKPSR